MAKSNERARIAAVPSIEEAGDEQTRTKAQPCVECRKLRREMKERDVKIERLLAALRRESYVMDSRAENSGYDSVRLKK